MPHSQFHLERAAALDITAKAGLPGPLEPLELAARGFFLLALALAAAGGIAVGLIAEWWHISYEHHELCKINANACSLHVQIALTWVCFQMPTVQRCLSSSSDSAAGHHHEGAWLPLVIALAVHGPLVLSLLVVSLLEACARNRQARTCSYRTVAFLALLASVLLVIVLVTFFTSVSPDFKFAQHLVGEAFGRIEMEDPNLKAAPSIAAVSCFAAFLCDSTLTCLACRAGEDDMLQSYPRHEVYVPSTHHIHLAPFAAGGPSSAGIYAAVPTSLEAAYSGLSAGNSVWRHDLKPLGRFQQWKFLT